MITKIIQALNSVGVKTIAYGDQLPNAPYCVVKPEADIASRGVSYSVIAHFLPGQQLELEDYILGTVGGVLDGFEAVDRHGNTNILEYDSGEIPGEYVVNNDDKTISMSRSYWMPSRIF